MALGGVFQIVSGKAKLHVMVGQVLCQPWLESGLPSFSSLVPRPSPQPCSQASTPASFPGPHTSLIPRPPHQSHSQAPTPVSFPGPHTSLVSRPPPQPHSQASTPASFPGPHTSLIPRPPHQPCSQASFPGLHPSFCHLQCEKLHVHIPTFENTLQVRFRMHLSRFESGTHFACICPGLGLEPISHAFVQV